MEIKPLVRSVYDQYIVSNTSEQKATVLEFGREPSPGMSFFVPESSTE